MNKISWKTEKRKLSELIPFEHNPRQANQKQREDLKRSLNTFNLADPIVINRDNTIIGGHFRVDVLKEKGKDQIVDVRVPSRPLTEKEVEELNLRLNRNTAEWDYDLLANFDEGLLKDVGFDDEFLGLADEELEEKEKEIKAIKKIHILLSFPVDKFAEVKKFLDEILRIEGIEYEQSSN